MEEGTVKLSNLFPLVIIIDPTSAGGLQIC